MSFYYKFVNFIQEMHAGWFMALWVALAIGVLVCVMKFFKIYNGEQKKFEKVSLIIIAIVMLAMIIYLTYIRK